MFKFVKSSTEKSNWYEHSNKEIAFWGRSNVGKSSLLNAIVDNKKLAKVSKTPGRTQLLNFFENEHGAVFVDLPGYGYAKLSQSQIQKMMKMIESYLIERDNLTHLFLLLDSRIPTTKSDKEVMEFLTRIHLPFTAVYTKVDKLNQKEKSALLKRIKLDMQTYKFDKYHIVSSETSYGIANLINQINEIFGENHE